MSEDGDFTPASWAPSDFKSARRAYDRDAGRSYGDAVATGKPISGVLEARLKTNCRKPLIIMCDQTGSMGEWPAVIFSKLPYLDHEVGEYLGKDAEVAFGAIGDAQKGENYPLQARPFSRGEKLQAALKELIIEGKGGGGGDETYELAMLYCLENVDMPKADHSILILIGDENPYDSVTKAMAAKYGIAIDKAMTTEEIVTELKEKFGAVYIIRKPYQDPGMDEQIHARWCKLLGSDHVVFLPDPNRVVDVIFGILGKESGKIDYFREEFESRQKDNPGYHPVVYKALETVHGSMPVKGATKKGLPPAGKSKMHNPGTGKKSKSLLGDDDKDE